MRKLTEEQRQKQREYNRRWRARNRDRLNAYQREWCKNKRAAAKTNTQPTQTVTVEFNSSKVLKSLYRINELVTMDYVGLAAKTAIMYELGYIEGLLNIEHKPIEVRKPEDL